MGGWVGNAVRKHFCPVKFSPPPIRSPRFSPSDSSPSPLPHLGPAILQLEDSRVHKTTYAPMIYTALCVRFLMWADRLRGEGGWVGAGNLEFCGPQIALAYRLVLFSNGNDIEAKRNEASILRHFLYRSETNKLILKLKDRSEANKI